MQSKFLSVGSVVPWAEPEVGAIATQAYANPRYGPNGLALLREGLRAAEVVERLTAADDGPRRAPARRRRRRGTQRELDRPRVQRLGRASQRPVLRGAGEHPRRRRDGRRARGDVRGERAVCRSRSACSSASPPRRPRAATGAASSRRRSSSSSATAATPRSPTSSSTSASRITRCPIEELRRIYGLHRRLFDVTPARGVAPARRRAARRGGRAPRRGSGYDSLARLGRRRESRGARRRRGRRSTPSSSRRCGSPREDSAASTTSRASPSSARSCGSPSAARSASRRSGSTRTPRARPATRSSRSTPSRRDEEAYIVIRGHATFTVDGEEIDAPWGTIVFLDDPKQKRHAIAKEAGTTVLAIGGEPGAHAISSWEYIFPSLPARNAGDWDTARTILEEALAERRHSRDPLPPRAGRSARGQRRPRARGARDRVRGAARLRRAGGERGRLRVDQGRPALPDAVSLRSPTHLGPQSPVLA